jgi:hypothetical protein
MHGRRLKATFIHGHVAHLTTEKGFTHCWRVTGMKGARAQEITGWARSAMLAKLAAEVYTRSEARRWKEVKAEVVEVETAL